MSFKDSIRRAIFVQPDKAEEKVSSTPKPIIPVKQNTIVNTSPPILTVTEGEVNEKIFDVLCQVIDANALPNANYLSLKDNIDKLKTILTSASEEDIIKAAFINMQVMTPSFSKDDIKKSVEHYIQIIDQEYKSENTLLAKEYEEKVNLPSANISGYKLKLQELAAEKNKIIQEEERLNSEINLIQANITSNKSIIDKKANDLTVTIKYLQKVLRDDSEKIINVLK